MKTCIRCFEEKCEEDYYFRANKRTRFNLCKVCARLDQRTRYMLKHAIRPQIHAKIAVALGDWRLNTIILLTLLTVIGGIRATRAICDAK